MTNRSPNRSRLDKSFRALHEEFYTELLGLEKQIKDTFSKKILPILNNIKNLTVNLVSIDNNY